MAADAWLHGRSAEREATAARALEFVILTAARTTEVLGAVWREVDLAEATWTIPARRMKAARPHRVALSPAAVAVLEGMKPLAAKPDSFIFLVNARDRGCPGWRCSCCCGGCRRLWNRLSRTSRPARVGPMPRAGDHAAWLSRVFQTWAGDRTSFAREIVEAALAHTIKDKVEAAYQRSDLLDRRRPLMAAWADHADGKNGAEIVEIATRRSA